MQWETVGKYFLHGIAFSIIYALLIIAWSVVLVVLVFFGYIIGLLIGLGLLLVIVGYLNTFLGDVLWGIKARGGFWMTLFHGFVLVIVLAVVNFLFVTLPTLISREIATVIITFIVGSFIDGIIGRYVASEFGEKTPETYQEQTTEE